MIDEIILYCFSVVVDLEIYEEIVIKKIGKVFDNKVDVKWMLREIKLFCYLEYENVRLFLFYYYMIKSCS